MLLWGMPKGEGLANRGYDCGFLFGSRRVANPTTMQQGNPNLRMKL